MKVYFRNNDDATGAPVGDMNMEELNDFVYSIRAEGFYVDTGDGMELMYPAEVRRYFYYQPERNFRVEVLWCDKDQV